MVDLEYKIVQHGFVPGELGATQWWIARFQDDTERYFYCELKNGWRVMDLDKIKEHTKEVMVLARAREALE